MKTGVGLKLRGLRPALALGPLLLLSCASQPGQREARVLRAELDLAAYRVRAPEISGPLGLADALRLARAHNIEVWIAAQQCRFQQELATAATLKLLPALTGGVDSSHRSELDAARSISLESGEESLEPSYSSERTTHRWDVAATWNLLDFGISFLKARQQSNRIHIARQQERRVRQNLELEVTRAFWQAVAARDVSFQADGLAAEVQARLEVLVDERAEATVTEVDGLRRETALLEQLEELRRYKRAYLSAKTELATLMGLPPGTEFELAEVDLNAALPEWEPDLAALEQEALTSRPELYEKDHEEAISRDEAHLAIAEMFPNFSVYWRYDIDDNRLLAFREWQTVGLRASWDLLSIPRQLARHNAMNLQTELVTKRRMAVAVAVLTQLHLAVIDWLEARAQQGLAREIAARHEALLSAVEAAAEQGASHAGEILAQRMAYLKACARDLSTYANAQTARARVLNTVGRDPTAAAPRSNRELLLGMLNHARWALRQIEAAQVIPEAVLQP